MRMLDWLTKPNDLAQRVIIRSMLFIVGWAIVVFATLLSGWPLPRALLAVPPVVITWGSLPWSIPCFMLPGMMVPIAGGGPQYPWWLLGLCIIQVCLGFSFNAALVVLALHYLRDNIWRLQFVRRVFVGCFLLSLGWFGTWYILGLNESSIPLVMRLIFIGIFCGALPWSLLVISLFSSHSSPLQMGMGIIIRMWRVCL